MKYLTLKPKYLTFFIILWTFISVHFANAQQLPQKVYANQSDYSFMWWTKTIKTGKRYNLIDKGI